MIANRRVITSQREELTVQRATIIGFTAGLVLTAASTFHFAPQAASQTGDGWIVLLDGKTMSDWNQVGQSNWRLEDGAVVADKLTGEGSSHLVSKKSYKDFVLHVEFWASDDANSGVYLRC